MLTEVFLKYFYLILFTPILQISNSKKAETC